LRHDGQGDGRFELLVGDQSMACGYTGDQLALLIEGSVRWLRLDQARTELVSTTPLVVRSSLEDAAGGAWQLTRSFVADGEGIAVQTEWVCDRDRQLLHAPVLTILAGLGTFAPEKTQGLLAGVEYLSNEPSSSQRDLEGAQAIRQIPDSIKITFPLMAIQHQERYVALVWEPSPLVCAVFDTPNRIYGSGGHLMAVAVPGVPTYRAENRLHASRPVALPAGMKLTARVTLLGGPGRSVAAAVQQYVRQFGLADVPLRVPTREALEYRLAQGWMNPSLNQGGLIRHAVARGGFPHQPAADASCYLLRLAEQSPYEQVRGRLLAQVQAARQHVTRANALHGVSHARPPIYPLVWGDVIESYAAAGPWGRTLLRGFGEDGSRVYRGPYLKGHWTNEASGHAARGVFAVLNGAVLSGDEQLIATGLRLTEALSKFDHGVPRGAQTWEISLHTPDIMASAHLVRVYVRAYELTKNPEWLERARHWAWTGVPFVYLRPPVRHAIGLYATIPVLGATNWTAPNWIGLPVQWCGLEYANALYELADYDHDGPWLRIARGITMSGAQQIWPASDAQRGGLLPDYFHLRAQVRDGPAINPGTLQVNLPGLYDDPPYYQFRRLRESGVIIHAPGRITVVDDRAGRARLEIDAWPRGPCYIALCALPARPAVQFNGQPLSEELVQHDGERRIAAVQLPQSGTLELTW
jgi:hypothetical protein